MDLVEEYLRAVGLLLPQDQRDDIVAELRDTVLSRIEAREAELRRPLTPDETEAVLRGVGHPLVVAARYRDGPQHVVGPALYPFWLFAVKAAVTLQAAVAAVIFVVRAASGGSVGQAFGQAVASTVSGTVTLVGIATIAAWLIERRGVKIGYLDRWRVRDLRMLDVFAWDAEAWRDRLSGWAEARKAARPAAAPWAGRRSASGPAGRGLGCIAASSVFTLWWVGALHFGLSADPGSLRDVGIEPGALARIDWADLKASLFWPGLAYGVLGIVQGFWLLARPQATALHGLFDLATGLALLAFVTWVWTASPLAPAVQVASVGDLVGRLRAAHGDDHAGAVALAPILTVALAVSAIAAMGEIGRGLWELVLPRPAPSSPWTSAAAR